MRTDPALSIQLLVIPVATSILASRPPFGYFRVPSVSDIHHSRRLSNQLTHRSHPIQQSTKRSTEGGVHEQDPAASTDRAGRCGNRYVYPVPNRWILNSLLKETYFMRQAIQRVRAITTQIQQPIPHRRFSQTVNMSQSRSVVKSVYAQETPEGVGATVRRSIGTPALRNISPFLM